MLCQSSATCTFTSHRLTFRCRVVEAIQLQEHKAAAERVRTVEDATRWVELESYSARRDVRTPIGGFAGRATFEGPLAPLLPWLIWGEYTHVGKNAVKGDGWYRIEEWSQGAAALLGLSLAKARRTS